MVVVAAPAVVVVAGAAVVAVVPGAAVVAVVSSVVSGDEAPGQRRRDQYQNPKINVSSSSPPFFSRQAPNRPAVLPYSIVLQAFDCIKRRLRELRRSGMTGNDHGTAGRIIAVTNSTMKNGQIPLNIIPGSTQSAEPRRTHSCRSAE